MLATDRLDSEREFHDRQARQRAADLNFQSLRFSDDSYLDHETWIRPAFAGLGDLAGRTALDYGCGHGMASVVMTRRGAIVTAFDLSAQYVAEARRRAADNGVSVHFVQADGHALPFAEASFDAVWGNAILHHLNLAIAGSELRRVLRPGGVAVFCEPWGDNPLLRWARQWLPYPGKERTRDEEPLRAADLAGLRQSFPDLHVEGYQLLTMVRRVVHVRPLLAALAACDRRLLRSERAQKWCRYVVLTLRRG